MHRVSVGGFHFVLVTLGRSGCGTHLIDFICLLLESLTSSSSKSPTDSIAVLNLQLYNIVCSYCKVPVLNAFIRTECLWEGDRGLWRERW